MKKTLALSLVFAAAFGSIHAQQTSTLDHYLVQPYLINSSAAGLNGNNIYLDYRKQWAGFTGAPETQVLALDGSIMRDKMGIGLMVTNDQVSFIGSTNVKFSYAYHLKFSDTHFLRLGLSGGITQNRINFSKVIAEDPTELQLSGSTQNASNFDSDAGLMYSIGNFQLGFSASHLFSGKYYYENNYQNSSLYYTNIRHFLVNAQYRFDITKGKWGIMPNIMIRTAQGLPFVYEGGVTGYYKKDAWLTLRYTHGIGYTAAIGGVIAKNIVAGYAYTMSARGLMGYNQGTHDIILGFRFPGSKNSGNAIDPKLLEDIKKQNNELYEKTDYLKNENDNLRKELDEQKKALKESVYGLDSLKRIIDRNNDELKKYIEEHQGDINNYQGPGNNNGNNGNNGNNNNNGTNNGTGNVNANGTYGNTVTQGDGRVYVIVGAFYNIEDCKRFQQIVTREYKEETSVIKKENSKWYFVYTKSFDTKENAMVERERAAHLDKLGIFVGGPWYFINK
jgi:type IX secretion system PorP/SprF family membrane protein